MGEVSGSSGFAEQGLPLFGSRQRAHCAAPGSPRELNKPPARQKGMRVGVPFRRGRADLVFSLAVLAVLSGCGSDQAVQVGDRSSLSAPWSTGPGTSTEGGAVGSITISGRYVVRPEGRAPAHGVGQQRIGLFPAGGQGLRRSASVGGRPMATTVTSANGEFKFLGVSPGDWIVAAHSFGGEVQSQPLRVTSTRGARVTLVACYECFAPRTDPRSSHT